MSVIYMHSDGWMAGLVSFTSKLSNLPQKKIYQNKKELAIQTVFILSEELPSHVISRILKIKCVKFLNYMSITINYKNWVEATTTYHIFAINHRKWKGI